MKIVSSSGTGNFIIKKESQAVLELKYQNWFSSKASTSFGGQSIEIRPKNIWCSKFDIFRSNQDKGDIIFNWKGHIIIRIIDDDAKENSYLLKAKGFWKQHFELTNEKGDLVFVLKPSMNWKKLSYNYEVEKISDEYGEKMLTELLVYCGFGANLYMTMAAAAATG